MIRSSNSSDDATTWRTVLESGLGAPGLARREVAAHLDGELGTERLKDLLLLTGELVTNSVRHADADATRAIVLELVLGLDAVRVVVTDGGSSTLPTMQALDGTRPGGRGLFLVASLSDSWGIKRDGTRETSVWFEMLHLRSSRGAGRALL